ncbi:MAG TPA: VWA domain-containing protein [Terracidiphilus sp.]|nr:VWA domain-containing protein [Terracidiphilus sp.]
MFLRLCRVRRPRLAALLLGPALCLIVCGTECLIASGTAWGQLAPSPDAAPVSNAPAQPVDTQPAANFKINVNLVDLFFTVTDKHGALIPHLNRHDCSISEDNVPQTIKSFTAEINLPLTIGLMLDTSGSQDRVLPLEQQAGDQFLRDILRPKDEAFLLSFDVNVDLLQDYTNSASQLARAMDKAQINTAGGNGAAGIPGLGTGPVPVQGTPKGTLLYDAIYLAASQKLADQSGRKALIILTDGQDQGSKTTLKEAIAAAQRSNTIIYVILLADPSAYGSFGMGYYGYSASKKIATETGGRVINVGFNGKKLTAAFQQIADELRSQYIATYTSTNARMDGAFRRITVQCNGDGYRIHARKGYYAPLPGS